jgi:cell division protein FtsL
LPVTEGIFNKIIAQLIKVLTIFLLLAVFNSFLQVLVISKSHEILKCRSQIEILEKKISRTKMEIASLESFDRIQTIALNELGMRTANSNDYRWVEAMPFLKEDTGAVNQVSDSVEMAEANLWGNLYKCIGELGKTMAKSLL